MSLKNDIKELIDNQVIDQATADRIASYYLSKKRSINVTAIISAVAAILVGTGVISIVAYNWDDLPNFVRTLIGIIPWAASSFGCYYTLRNKPDQKSWNEAMAILQLAGFSATFAIVNQIYQVQLDGEAFACICVLVSLPFVFLMRSACLSAILISMVCLIGFDCRDIFSKITMYVVLVADVAFLYDYYYRKSEGFLCSLRVVGLPVFWVSFFFLIIGRDLGMRVWNNLFPCLFLIFASVSYVMYEWIGQSDRIKSRGTILKYLFYLVFFPSLLYFSHEGVKDYYDAKDFILPVIAALPIFVSVGLKLSKSKVPQWQTWIGLAFAVIAVICGEQNYATALFALAAIAYCLYMSCQDYDLLKMNVSILSLFGWAFVVLGNYNLPFYLYGLILILLGVALILMNKYIIEKKRSNGVTENR